MKKAIRCIAFLIVLALSINVTYKVLFWKDTSGGYISSTQQLYATEENLMDVVFLGSSHCYCGITPDVLWGNYGISAFNMTTSGQDKKSTEHMLKELLKTQSPKVVCVELWGLTFDEHAVQGNVYRNMMAMKLSRNSIELVKAYVDKEEQMDYILRWPIVHTRYKELDKYDFVTYEYSEFGRGMPMSYSPGWSEFPGASLIDELGELTDSNREWLENLYQLSIEEEFELILFMAPSGVDEEQQKQVNAAKAFALENGITFFDFNRLVNELQIDYSQDFVDMTHLNGWGAEKLTMYFGAFFDANYELEDHRGEDAYYQWEDSYTDYSHGKALYELQRSKSLEEYIENLQKMDQTTYVVSFEGTYKDSTLELRRAAKLMGLTDEDYDAGGTFICVDGQWEHLIDNESEEVVFYELNEYDAFKVQNTELTQSDETAKNGVKLNLETVGICDNGLNIIVYDEFRQQLIDKRGYY